jgi:hypothetical protein
MFGIIRSTPRMYSVTAIFKSSIVWGLRYVVVRQYNYCLRNIFYLEQHVPAFAIIRF